MRHILRILILSAAVIATGIIAASCEALGSVVSTDIVSFIDYMPVESYNYNDNTYIIVEDLNGYGFDVVYNDGERALYVTRNVKKSIDYMAFENVNIEKANISCGEYLYDVLETDIKTYLNGDLVNSFNINGKTIIAADNLKKYGELSWNESGLNFADGMSFSFLEQPRSLLLNVTLKELKDEYKAVPSDNIYQSQDSTPVILEGGGMTMKATSYTGQIKNGKKSGIGLEKVQIFSSLSEVYFGEFENGARSGRGIYYWISNAGQAFYYTGGFYNDEFDGFGVINQPACANATRQEGIFREGKLVDGRTGYPDGNYKFGYKLDLGIV